MEPRSLRSKGSIFIISFASAFCISCTTFPMGKRHALSTPSEPVGAGGGAQEVYEATGDAEAALALLQGPRTTDLDDTSSSSFLTPQVNAYNATVLRQEALRALGTDEYLDELQRAEETYLEAATRARDNETTRQQLHKRLKLRDQFITSYNRALALWEAGRVTQSLDLLTKTLEPWIIDAREQQQLSEELLILACRLAFLLLESFLAVTVGNDKRDGSTSTPSMEQIVSWLQKSVEKLAEDKAPPLKFLLALYLARLDLQTALDQAGKRPDAKIRSARKELKVAMEVFQHKLLLKHGGADGSSSLASSSIMSNDELQASSYSDHQQAVLPKTLQTQNQAALNLKANAEQLKGNIKKSLVLLAEAQAATNNDAEDPLHYNNLAIVYETHGKPHLALHAWSKACAALESHGNISIHPEHKVRVLFNAGMGGLQAQKYDAAYECLGLCLAQSPDVWAQRPRVWLRLGEACLGLWSRQLEKKKSTVNGSTLMILSKRDVNAEVSTENSDSNKNEENEDSNENVDKAPKRTPKGILIYNSGHRHGPLTTSIYLHDLASPEDMEGVRDDPLPRARLAFEQAIALFEKEKQSTGEEFDELGFASAQLSLAYVCLELNDYTNALKYAISVLNTYKALSQEKISLSVARKSLWERQHATARLYAAEASCALGDFVSSMRHLVGDGKDDAFDRLASQLSGVTIERAASNPKGKARLAKAQAMVRCSASTASAHLGNLPAAKQLAMSAQAMEDAYSSSREGSSARRALIYCMMKEGNKQAALSLLRSSR